MLAELLGTFFFMSFLLKLLSIDMYCLSNSGQLISDMCGSEQLRISRYQENGENFQCPEMTEPGADCPKKFALVQCLEDLEIEHWSRR